MKSRFSPYQASVLETSPVSYSLHKQGLAFSVLHGSHFTFAALGVKVEEGVWNRNKTPSSSS